jgi:uncharacterized repeat protein (TIGR04138 family)
MSDTAFRNAIKTICARDRRYASEAYVFVKEALDFTIKSLNKPADTIKRHVSGGELLEGIREYALQEFGPMAMTVFRTWGIKATDDFGEIVFNMVDSEVLGKTDTDKKEDFAGIYDFYNTFAKPFLPMSASAEQASGRKTLTAKRRRSKR